MITSFKHLKIIYKSVSTTSILNIFYLRKVTKKENN